MKLTLLLNVLPLVIKGGIRKNKSLRKFISTKSYSFVIKTEDNKSGKRFNFRYGKFSTDKNLDAYDLALIFKDAGIAFDTLTSKDEMAAIHAINNWQLKLDGDVHIINWFSIVTNVSAGKWKRV